MVHVVRIRLARWGQKGRPFYRIVATYNKRKRDGRHLEVVGAYNPLFETTREREARVKRVWLNIDRIKYWLANGAQPSETVARLLGTSGLLPISPRTVVKTTITSGNANTEGNVAKAAASKRAFSSCTTSPSQGLADLLRERSSSGIREKAAIMR